MRWFRPSRHAARHGSCCVRKQMGYPPSGAGPMPKWYGASGIQQQQQLDCQSVGLHLGLSEQRLAAWCLGIGQMQSFPWIDRLRSVDCVRSVSRMELIDPRPAISSCEARDKGAAASTAVAAWRRLQRSSKPAMCQPGVGCVCMAYVSLCGVASLPAYVRCLC